MSTEPVRNGMCASLGPWLRAQHEERNWSRSDMARKLAAARQAGGARTPDACTLRKSIHRRETGQVTVSGRYRLLYCRACVPRVGAGARTGRADR